MRSMQDLQLPFPEARLAVVGAGKMTRLLVTHLASRGLEKMAIVNRSMKRPEELAGECVGGEKVRRAFEGWGLLFVPVKK